MNPTLARIPVPFRWNVHDGLNGSSLLARAYNSEIAGVYSRTSTKRVADRNGLLVPLVQGIPALGVFGGEVGLLLEPARTNLCIRSEEFSDAAWTKTNCSVTANAVAAPDLTVTADLLTATAGSGNALRAVTFTGDGEKCVAVFLKQGTGTFVDVALVDNTAGVARHRVRLTWATLSAATGTGAGTIYPVEQLRDGWVRLLFSATGVVAANVNQVFVYPDGTGAGAGAGTTSVYAWGAQAEDAVVPSSYIPTAGSTVARTEDTLYFPFTLRPAALTVYVRCVELARLTSGSGGSFRKWQIGSATAGAAPQVTVYDRGNANGYAALHNNGSATVSVTNTGATVDPGSLSETRLVVRADGAILLGVADDGAAESTTNASGANALGAAWADTRLYLNSAGGSFRGISAFTHVCVALGEQPLDIMRELAGV